MGNAERAKPYHRNSDDRAGLYRASEVVPSDSNTPQFSLDSIQIVAAGDGLTRERCPDLSEVVVTVAHRMIFQHELAGEGSITIERYRRGTIQLCIA
jgi:hypothetical protein